MTPVYYVREIEKVMIAIMDVFNNLRVKRYDDQNRTVENRTVAVPLYSHNSDDFANYVSSTATAQEPMPVPCAGFRYVSNRHDETHMVQPTYAREILAEDIEKFVRDIQPTPMTITFELTVLSDNLADFFFLKEQIEPYFNTYRTVRIKEWDFAPKIERPIPFKITWSDNIDDEKGDTSNEYQFYKTTYTIEAIAVYHRPYELPAIIKYAQMNFIVNNEYQDSLQVFVYPDEIAQQKKHLWETVEPSIREGWSLLKTFTRTLVRRTDENGEEYWKDMTMKELDLTIRDPNDITHRNQIGKTVGGYNPIYKGNQKNAAGKEITDADGDPIPIYSWEDVVVGDVARPVEVPQFDLIHLNFDEDTDLEVDYSGMGRDFVAVNDETREFVPDLAPGNGSYAPGGYETATDWSHILNWFGDNKEGKIEESYTFKATLQFKQQCDTVFQYLYNPEDVTLSDGTVIPKGEVWFDWGVSDGKLYFAYHTTSMFKRFESEPIRCDNTTIYSFYFVLYDEGKKGAFGVKTNFSETMIALRTTEAT